ncbi:MAG: phosphatidylglycerol lysyltransferase domain-containing protein [Clostridiaceae bacterium]
MDFAEITLHDKYEFDRLIKQHKPQISELTFTNLFAWRHYYKFRYTVKAGLLCIVSAPLKGEPFAMMPVGNVNEENFSEALSSLKEYFKGRGWRFAFKKISSEELHYFENRISSRGSVVYDRDNSDYLYNTADLTGLRGKKYDGKRNHINKFKKQHSFEYVPLECSLLDECSRIMEEWCKEKNCDCQEGDYCERFANLELLKNFKVLGCKGALIKVDGLFEAFTAGEMLNDDTAVIHIEKAKSSVDGLYPIINQQFAEREWSTSTFINREQDLGQEGMRRAKLSYQPVRLIDKYTVYPD